MAPTWFLWTLLVPPTVLGVVAAASGTWLVTLAMALTVTGQSLSIRHRARAAPGAPALLRG